MAAYNKLTDRATAIENQILAFHHKKNNAIDVANLQQRYEKCQQCGKLGIIGCTAYGCQESGARRRFYQDFTDPDRKCPFNSKGFGHD